MAQLTLDGLGGEELLYLTTDHLGTPEVALDATGATVWDSAFEPFGRDAEEATTQGATENGLYLRFPGQWDDGRWEGAALGAGVYYNVHRWYQPGSGRYGRPDPIRLTMATEFSATAQGMINPYGYVNARPTIWMDPLGLEATTSDRINCLFNPIDCGQVRDCRIQAERATRTRFGVQGRNDPSDAYRHCYWSCCMAKRIGASEAEKFGNGHENRPDNPKCEMIMDLTNNATGRGTGPHGPATDCDTHCSSTPLLTQPPGDCCPIGVYPDGPPFDVPPPVPRQDIGGGV